MPLGVCPSPEELTGWQNAMLLAGALLLLLTCVGLAAVAANLRGAVRRRGAARVVALSCLTLALGIWSLMLANILHNAFAQIAFYFYDYPTGCTPNEHGPPEYYVKVYQLAQQVAAAREQAALITIFIAAALAICQILSLRAWRRQASSSR